MPEARASGAPTLKAQRRLLPNRACTRDCEARHLRACLAVVCAVATWACVQSGPGERASGDSDAGSGIDQDVVVDIDYDILLTVTPQQVQRLESFVRRRLAFRGLPFDVLQGRTIRVNLVADAERGVDAIAFPLERVVALPADRVVQWDSIRLDRVVRHEIAHLALGTYFGGASLPMWLKEGFPEWVAGSLDCVGEARVRLAVVTNARRGLPPFGLVDSLKEGPSRLEYDLYGTFLDYLEQRQRNVVASGAFLAAVRDYGISEGVRVATGARLEDLETQWQRHIALRYGSVPDNYSCS